LSDAERPFFPLHLLGSLLRGIIVSQQVEDAVRQQEPNFVVQVDFVLLSLARGRFDGDDDVSEQLAHDLTRMYCAHDRSGAAASRGSGRSERRVGMLIALREGENIGGPVLPAIVPIENVNRRIIRQENAHFSRGHPFRLKDLPRGLKQSPDL